METIEGLKKQIESTNDLSSVVGTMKALSAATIRQYEEAVESLNEYNRSIELGLQIVLQNSGSNFLVSDDTDQIDIIIIFGSDQGMCGHFNDIIVQYAEDKLLELAAHKEDLEVWPIGERLLGPLGQRGFSTDQIYNLPNSVDMVNQSVQEVLMDIELFRQRKTIQGIYLVYNFGGGSTLYRQHFEKLWPLDSSWLRSLQKKEWPARTVPQIRLAPKQMFQALSRESIYISLYRAFAESLAAENAGRLVTMETAQKNIEEREQELQKRYNQLRQTSIDNELFDIIAGFTALEE